MLDPNVMTCLPHVVEIDGAPVRLREEKYLALGPNPAPSPAPEP